MNSDDMIDISPLLTTGRKRPRLTIMNTLRACQALIHSNHYKSLRQISSSSPSCSSSGLEFENGSTDRPTSIDGVTQEMSNLSPCSDGI